MANVTREYPIMTPDSLRAKLKMDRKLFGTYTPRTFMREHTNGTKYVGTLENWGDEMLLESHKLKMLHIPFQSLNCSQSVYKYFDLHYSGEVNHMMEPNCIMLCLKKDVLLNEQRCYVKFLNCKKLTVLRATSTSDPNVTVQTIFKTTTPPELWDNASLTKIGDLVVCDPNYDYLPTTYYFNTTTVGETLPYSGEINGIYETDQPLFDQMKRNFINPSYFNNDTHNVVNFRTMYLKDWMNELPFVWCSVPTVTTFEDGDIVENIDRNDNTLLTFGADGHDNMGWFVNVLENNLPPLTDVPEGEEENVKWLLKAYAKYDDFEEVTSYGHDVPVHVPKYEKELRKISLCSYIEEPGFQHILHTFDIKWNMNEIHVFINYTDDIEWSLHTPSPDDTDYDGITYNNPKYKYVSIDDGIRNYAEIPSMVNNQYRALFTIKTEKQYSPLISTTPGAHVGTHIDFSSDYSEHSVDKKYGTIYNLGDYDGLPEYYHIKNARYLKRGHVTLYTTRTWVGKTTASTDIKQNAALLIDSGLPRIQSNTGNVDLDPVIVYQYNPIRTYYTKEPPISILNAMSDIVYNGGNSFGDIHNSDITHIGSKMIYHGNRKFSTTVSGEIDPSEYGRVYIISNDSSSYENNEETNCEKPPRTFARICDIPTDYRQLISVSGLVSSVIMDEWYVHTDVNYTDGDIDNSNDMIYIVKYPNDEDEEIELIPYIDGGMDLQRTWNQYEQACYVHRSKHVYESTDDLNSASVDISTDALTQDPTNCKYSNWVNRNARMDMKLGFDTVHPEDDYTWTITEEGSDYNVNDELKDFVGGKLFKGSITSVDANYGVQSVEYNNDTKYPMNYHNLDDRIMTYHPAKILTSTTETRSVELTLTITEEKWNDLKAYVDGLLPNMFTFKMNEYGQLTIWEYDNDTNEWKHHCVVTGDDLIETPYNESLDPAHYTTNACMMKKMFSYAPYIAGYSDAPDTLSPPISKITPPTPYLDGDQNPNLPSIDFSQQLVDRGFNQAYTYHTIDPDDGTDNLLNVYKIANVLEANATFAFPKSSRASITDYTQRVDGLLFSGFNNGSPQMGYVTKQPNVYIYDPIKTDHDIFRSISSDIVQLVESNPITFRDMEDVASEIGILEKNVYKYCGYELTDAFINKCDEYEAMLRDDLYQLALTKDPIFKTDDGINPIQFAEDNGNPYTKTALIEYLLEFDMHDEDKEKGAVYRPLMDSDSIKKIRSAGETVFHVYNDEVTPEGVQPYGDLVSVSATKFDGRCSIGPLTKAQSTLLYVMRIPDDAHIESFYNYHIKDQYSYNDISDKTLLLYKNEMYTFRKDLNTWLKVRRKLQ